LTRVEIVSKSPGLTRDLDFWTEGLFSPTIGEDVSPPTSLNA